MNKSSIEKHPNLPSGEWEGFYNYGENTVKGNMSTVLRFGHGKVTGSGVDPVGAFTWNGTYSLQEMTCTMIKSYRTHTVKYNGQVDENGIWGMWTIINTLKGGFHIWPKKKEKKQEAVAKKEVKINQKQKVLVGK